MSDSAVIKCDARIGISNKFAGEADVFGPGATF
jgi:hypothetical protein